MTSSLPPSSNEHSLSVPRRPRRLWCHGGALICALSWIFCCGPAAWPGGIHAVVGWSPERVRVVDVPAGSTAAEAGLHVDDVVVAIDGHPVAGLSVAEVQGRLRGEVGVPVRLRVLRAGREEDLLVPRVPYAHRRSVQH
jgi:predicted metalloprotease with PDZ domain